MSARPVGWRGRPRDAPWSEQLPKGCPERVSPRWARHNSPAAASSVHFAPVLLLLPAPSESLPASSHRSLLRARYRLTQGPLPGHKLSVQAGHLVKMCRQDPVPPRALSHRPGCHLLHAQLLLQSGAGQLLRGSVGSRLVATTSASLLCAKLVACLLLGLHV